MRPARHRRHPLAGGRRSRRSPGADRRARAPIPRGAAVRAATRHERAHADRRFRHPRFRGARRRCGARRRDRPRPPHGSGGRCAARTPSSVRRPAGARAAPGRRRPRQDPPRRSAPVRPRARGRCRPRDQPATRRCARGPRPCRPVRAAAPSARGDRRHSRRRNGRADAGSRGRRHAPVRSSRPPRPHPASRRTGDPRAPVRPPGSRHRPIRSRARRRALRGGPRAGVRHTARRRRVRVDA